MTSLLSQDCNESCDQNDTFVLTALKCRLVSIKTGSNWNLNCKLCTGGFECRIVTVTLIDKAVNHDQFLSNFDFTDMLEFNSSFVKIKKGKGK